MSILEQSLQPLDTSSSSLINKERTDLHIFVISRHKEIVTRSYFTDVAYKCRVSFTFGLNLYRLQTPVLSITPVLKSIRLLDIIQGNYHRNTYLSALSTTATAYHNKPAMSPPLIVANENICTISGSPYNATITHAIQVADEITRRHAARTNWSSWHTWDYIRHNPTPSSSTIWEAIHPFSTCVGFSTAIAASLRAAYCSIPGLAHLADHVHTMASWELDPQCPEEGERPRHCVAALLTAEACLLVDLVYEPIVMVIPAGGAYETMPYITMSGRLGKRVLHYDGSRLEMANLKRENPRRDLFRVIAPEEALKSISTVTSTAMNAATGIPTNKVVIIRGTVDESPVKIPSMQLGDRVWMITTCRLQTDFSKRQLTLQIPMEDWLLKDKK